ncbi:hypothetical protein [Variovorax saccharolyticus]|uniref:hypothetical protein n=1 Tax=Variovorax saccharolyticus TaxID=3053516 RepID=UPI0025759B23|nr:MULTISPECIES: hypothetical protein [unclassified Variovorax]MDM0017398.1 hypothetical protein [Variovorax sp. J22R187]MDM0026916.1 hypothetical protein [Variovorax sp. J31P216]
MKQYLLTFLVAACAACTHIVAPAKAPAQGDALATSSMLPAMGRVLPQGGNPW